MKTILIGLVNNADFMVAFIVFCIVFIICNVLNLWELWLIFIKMSHKRVGGVWGKMLPGHLYLGSLCQIHPVVSYFTINLTIIFRWSYSSSSGS